MKQQICRDRELPARKGEQCLHHYYKDWKASRHQAKQGEDHE